MVPSYYGGANCAMRVGGVSSEFQVHSFYHRGAESAEGRGEKGYEPERRNPSPASLRAGVRARDGRDGLA
jgi:hypothetical protein